MIMVVDLEGFTIIFCNRYFRGRMLRWVKNQLYIELKFHKLPISRRLLLEKPTGMTECVGKKILIAYFKKNHLNDYIITYNAFNLKHYKKR